MKDLILQMQPCAYDVEFFLLRYLDTPLQAQPQEDKHVRSTVNAEECQCGKKVGNWDGEAFYPYTEAIAIASWDAPDGYDDRFASTLCPECTTNFIAEAAAVWSPGR